MAFQAVPNVLACVVEYGATALQWTNTWYFFTLLRGADRQILCANLLHQEIGTEIMPEIAQDWDLRQITCYDLTSDIILPQLDTETPVAGSKVDPPLAVNCAMVMTLRTDIRGRSGRGRHYIAGFTEAQGGSTGFVNQSLADTMEAAYGTIDGVLATNQFLFVTVQRWKEKVLLDPAEEHYVQTYEVRDLKYGSQRRRIPRP